jgi:hypothetical protein
MEGNLKETLIAKPVNFIREFYSNLRNENKSDPKKVRFIYSNFIVVNSS